MGQEDRIVEIEHEGAPPEGQEAFQDGWTEKRCGTVHQHDVPEAPERDPTSLPGDRGRGERGLAEEMAGALHQARQDRAGEGKDADLDAAFLK